MRILHVLVVIGALTLAGCGKREPEKAPDVENIGEVGGQVDDRDVVAPESNMLDNAVMDNKAEPTPPPPPKVSDDEQMREDAEASGMTARVPDQEAAPADGGQPENQARPAD